MVPPLKMPNVSRAKTAEEEVVGAGVHGSGIALSDDFF